MPPKKTTKAMTPQPKKGAVAMLKQQKAPRSAPPGKSKPKLKLDNESDNEEDTDLFAKLKTSMFQDANLLKQDAAGSDDSDEDMDTDSDDDEMDFSDDDGEEGDEKDSSLHTTRSGLKRQIDVAKALMANGKSKANKEAKNTSTPLSEKKAKTPQAKKTDTPNVKSKTIKTPVQKKSETPVAEKAKTPKSAKLKVENSNTAKEKSPTKGVEAITSDKAAVTPGEKKQKDNLSPSRKRKSSQNDDKDSQDSGVGMSMSQTAAARTPAELDRRTLFVKGLPHGVTENDLKKLSVEAQSIRIKSHERLKARAPPPYAFLEYTSEAVAEKNYKKLTGAKIGDQKIVVDYVGEKSKNRKNVPINLLKLYIGGYSESTTADELRKLFQSAKEIVFPKRTKSFCFATYFDENTAKAAYAKGQGLKLNNVPLVVDYAKSMRQEKSEKSAAKKAKLEEEKKELDESDEDDEDYEGEEEDDAKDDSDEDEDDEDDDDDDDDEEDK